MIKEDKLTAFNVKYAEIKQKIDSMRSDELNGVRKDAAQIIESSKIYLRRFGVNDSEIKDLSKQQTEISNQVLRTPGVSPDSKEELFYRYAEEKYPQLSGSLATTYETVKSLNAATVVRDLNNRSSELFRDNFVKDGRIDPERSANRIAVDGQLYQSSLAKLEHNFPKAYKTFEADSRALAKALSSDLHRIDSGRALENLDYLLDNSKHPAFADRKQGHLADPDTRSDLLEEVAAHNLHVGTSHIDRKEIPVKRYDKIIAEAASQVKQNGLPRGAMSEMAAVSAIAMARAKEHIPKEEMPQFYNRLAEKTGVKIADNRLTEGPNLHLVVQNNVAR